MSFIICFAVHVVMGKIDRSGREGIGKIEVSVRVCVCPHVHQVTDDSGH
jgi:hypothetical protein